MTDRNGVQRQSMRPSTHCLLNQGDRRWLGHIRRAGNGCYFTYLGRAGQSLCRVRQAGQYRPPPLRTPTKEHRFSMSMSTGLHPNTGPQPTYRPRPRREPCGSAAAMGLAPGVAQAAPAAQPAAASVTTAAATPSLAQRAAAARTAANKAKKVAADRARLSAQAKARYLKLAGAADGAREARHHGGSRLTGQGARGGPLRD